ncbi:stage II sporulation protein P [Evansella caseinilytica]|uniref:Stage II sporulation protein P n=1 Tax=Evansella caseinilytica TaxID=1503961 RepID=A0A1H3KHL2_9BACI|nr:stage II sporulation protein P [Evansella caseinilytica]SDY51098.1 stage II sporulation protein P [Evansella caseinilytica]
MSLIRRGMYRKKHHIHVQWNGTSVKKSFFTLIAAVVGLFFTTSMMTAFGPGHSLSSAYINDAGRKISNEMFVYMLGMENRYFTQALPEDAVPPSVASTVFKLATSLNPDDPRSLLGRELPGFALFDGKILAGEGIDYTEMPLESAPPLEVLMAEREASTERLEEIDAIREQLEETDVLEQVVHIIHSHNRESYYPELEADADAPFHHEVNITLAGEKLGIELAKRGIGADVDTTDINAELVERGWQYSQSYSMAREVLEEMVETNGEYEFYFDLHRDSQRREKTTVEINGESYAQILFVVGEKNPDHEKNRALAEELYHRLAQHKPGVVRGIFSPPNTPGANGIYNQDFSPNSLLIEFGGVDNTLEEVYRSVEVFAEVFSEFYYDALER